MSTTTWAIDPSHSEIGFKVKHMMFTNVSGKFQRFDSRIQVEGKSFENANIRFEAYVDSITTGNTERDAHLLSGDFFDAEQYPKILFNSTSFTKINEGDFKLQGDLTLHGITKAISLAVEYGGQNKDPWGNVKTGFIITGKINRKDFGLNWNSTLDAGGVLVGEDVKLDIEIQFIKQ